MITIAVLGLGQRGTGYALWTKLRCSDRAKVVALCDKNKDRLSMNARRHKIKNELCFNSADELFDAGRIAEAIYICTQDRDHYGHAIRAIELGYDILLEKPVSPDIDECREIAAKAAERGVKVVVCHIMRYMAFYKKLNELVKSGSYGKITSIEHTENIGYFHFAHSYVRGNWHSSQATTPMLLAKCCHDFDFIDWLMGGGCRSVSSLGTLGYFTSENAPDGCGERCLDCPKNIKKRCPYDAERLYITTPLHKATFVRFMRSVVTGKPNSTKKDAYEALRTGDYGRCVYKSDNDVCDRQTALLDYGDGRFANITATAFSKKCFRRTVIHLERADIFAESAGNKIILSDYLGKVKRIRINETSIAHLAGDAAVVRSFIDLLEGKSNEDATLIETTVASHSLVMLCEQSRKLNGERLGTQPN